MLMLMHGLRCPMTLKPYDGHYAENIVYVRNFGKLRKMNGEINKES